VSPTFCDTNIGYSPPSVVFPILAGLSTNTISKMFLAGISGGRVFALRVMPGLIVVALAAWVGMLAT
jgi:TRAP-type C4-dicarboxylate transport system permease large subunit